MSRSQSAPMLDDELGFPGHGNHNQQGHNQKPTIPQKAYHFDQNYNPQVSLSLCVELKEVSSISVTDNKSNQSGDYGPPGPSPFPQHTRLRQPLIQSAGVHQPAREDVTEGASEPSVPRIPPAGNVFFPSVPDQPGRPARPTAAADPISTFQARVLEESRLPGELHRARSVPPSP